MANIDQQIAIPSVPDGADVKIENMSGTTPMTLTCLVGMASLKPSRLVQDIVPGILLGPIPLITDDVTGDWANSSYNVRLQPISGSMGRSIN